jgi:hypothetical protein
VSATRSEPIRGVLGAREARMRRAVERWQETSDARGCPLEALAEAAAAHAELLGRDLSVAEIAAGCAAVVSAWVDAEEQREAEEARQGDAERERLGYLSRTAARLRLTREPP